MSLNKFRDQAGAQVEPSPIHPVHDNHPPLKYLFVASTGGHLAELVRLSKGLHASPDSLWITFDSPQSRSLLAGLRTAYVPYISQRDWRGTLFARRQVQGLLGKETFDQAISTGAAIAVSALPVAASCGIPSTYIESVSRVEGPSLAGRILRFHPRVKLRTQHAGWATKHWVLCRSVLDEFETRERPEVSSPRLFITLGTLEKYRFDSLIDSVLATGLADERTTWQIGCTTRDDLPGRVVESMDADEFKSAVDEADVVVSHAGAGTLLHLLESGVHPVLGIRRRARREHVDDHQAQIAELATRLGIAVARDPAALTANALRRASRKTIVPRTVGGAAR